MNNLFCISNMAENNSTLNLGRLYVKYFWKWLPNFINSQVTLIKNFFIDINNSHLLNPVYVFVQIWTVVLFQNINNCSCCYSRKAKKNISVLQCIIWKSRMSEIHHCGLNIHQILGNECQNSCWLQKTGRNSFKHILSLKCLPMCMYLFLF